MFSIPFLKPWTLAVGVALYTLSRVYKSMRGRREVGYIPGIRTFFEPFTFLGAVLPSFWWPLYPGVNFQWERRKTLYKQFNRDSISIVPYLAGSARLWTANLDVARQVVVGGSQPVWIKPREYSRALLFWGMNLAGAEGGELWRRHRRIMGPAFNNKTYALVWNETLRVYKDMMVHEGWESKSSIDVPVVQTYTFKLALFIIASCGFGLPFDWSEPPTGNDDEMTIQEALRVVSETNFMYTMAPGWFLSLPLKKVKYAKQAHKTLDTFMRHQVAVRKTEIRREIAENGSEEISRDDVFSRLVLANESEAEKLPLDDQEMIGSTFVLLFAGHETTGHTLAATLGFLASHPDEQDAVYNQIMDVVGHDRDPTFEDYSALYKVLAAFYEALRFIPAGSVMIRQTTQDTMLSVPKSFDSEETEDVLMPNGSVVTVDMLGIQCNPRYFPDPFTYKPSRWYEQETSQIPDAFTAFSVGPRACIGRKFAQVEAVCWLALLLRDWKVEPLLRPGETREEWRERVLTAQLVLTLTVGPMPLRFVKRTKV